MAREASNLTSFARPLSTTYRISGMVSEVSATFVETTTSRCPGGGGLNTSICFSLGSSAYSGTMCMGTKHIMSLSACYTKDMTYHLTQLCLYLVAHLPHRRSREPPDPR